MHELERASLPLLACGFRPELFREDGIHLIDAERAEWSRAIVPALTDAGAQTRAR